MGLRSSRAIIDHCEFLKSLLQLKTPIQISMQCISANLEYAAILYHMELTLMPWNRLVMVNRSVGRQIVLRLISWCSQMIGIF
jgi:hypothetical protein